MLSYQAGHSHKINNAPDQTFAQVALDYRFAPELCYPKRPNQKGSVENLVGWVKGSFFKVRLFHDRTDRESQLAEWQEEANLSRPCRATNVIPADRMTAGEPLPFANARMIGKIEDRSTVPFLR